MVSLTSRSGGGFSAIVPKPSNVCGWGAKLPTKFANIADIH